MGNEIEPSSTTYFVRWLKFDCLPLYGKLYAQKAREIYKQLMKTKSKGIAKRAANVAKPLLSNRTEPTKRLKMTTPKTMKVRSEKQVKKVIKNMKVKVKKTSLA